MGDRRPVRHDAPTRRVEISLGGCVHLTHMELLKMILAALILVSVVISAQSAPRIIDMHVHAFPAEWSPAQTPFNMTTGKPSLATTGVDLMPQVVAELRRYNVRLAVLSGPVASVREWRRASPATFIGAPQFPMTYLHTRTEIRLENYLPTVAELEHAVRAGDVGAVGEITAQYAGLAPDAPEFAPFLDFAEKFDLPVGIHTGTGPPAATLTYPGHRVALGNPMLLDSLLARRPKLRLYLMHAGYPYLQETVAILHMYPQIYADLSAINWKIPRSAFHAYLQQLVVAGFAERLMFGSDSEAWPEGIELAIEGIRSATFLTDSQKQDIFCGNAARFLRLENDVCSN